MNTPWGESQVTEVVADGVLWVSTASHGGYRVSAPALNAIPHEWRTFDHWYEEDCEALIVLAFVPVTGATHSLEVYREHLRALHPQGLREIRAPRESERRLGVAYCWGLANA